MGSKASLRLAVPMEIWKLTVKSRPILPLCCSFLRCRVLIADQTVNELWGVLGRHCLNTSYTSKLNYRNLIVLCTG